MESAVVNKDLLIDGKILPFHSEYVYDSRSLRRWKRKHRSSKFFSNCNTGVSEMKYFGGAAEKDLSSKVDDGSFINPMENDDIDPQYDMFLKHLRLGGKSYAFEAGSRDGTPTLLWYEEEACIDEELPLSPKRLRTEPIGKMKIPESLRNFPTEKRNVSLVDKNLPLEHAEVATCVPNEGARLEDCPKIITGKSKNHPKKKSEKKSRMVEETYQTFLNCLRWVGDTIVLRVEGNDLIYEKDYNAEVSSTSRSVEARGVPCSNNVGIDEVCIRSETRVCPKFRDDLLSELRKPYDNSEYEELWTEISLCKQVERFKDLRGRIKSFPTGIYISYLDQYPDVKEKIDLFRHDCCKVLNILRGFFFWLKNLAHQGSFRPWLDKSCLKVMALPGSAAVSGPPLLLNPKPRLGEKTSS